MSKVRKAILVRFDMNGRQFKTMFRGRLRRIRMAVEDYRQGCAYTPREAYQAIERIEKDLAIMEKSMSAKEWGR